MTGVQTCALPISAFTLGHSITLITATYLEVSVNEYLIDAIIGLSVFYKGFENLEIGRASCRERV